MSQSIATEITESKRPNRKVRAKRDYLAYLAFLIPCLQFVQWKLVGVIDGSDILLLLIFIFLVFRGSIRFGTQTDKWFLVLCSLWLAGQCVTDIVRHSAFEDYARGWSNIGMSMVNFAVFSSLLEGRLRRLVFYGWGIVAGSFIAFYVNPDELIQVDPWKFGLSYPVTLGAFFLVSREKSSSQLQVAVSVILGLVNFYLGTRYVGGVCLAVALYLQMTRYIRRHSAAASNLSRGAVIAIVASLVLSVVGVFWGYQYAAGSGMLGDTARNKFEGESMGAYGVLLGGRTEMLGSIPAIYDSPILGHGSWAKDPIYRIAEIRAAIALGYKDALITPIEELEVGYIPKHSYIFGAWVDAGIAGAIFWGWVFALAVRSVMRVYPSNLVLLPVLCFIALSLLWNILFSPYGSDARIIVPYYIVLLSTCMSMKAMKAGSLANVNSDTPRLDVLTPGA